MEVQQPPPLPNFRPHQDELRAMSDRLLRMETAWHYEREALYREIGGLAWQLHTMRQEIAEATVLSPVTASGWIKLVLAILLPLAVFLVTGSAERAMHAATIAP